MQFSNFTRTETGNIVLFKNTSPLQGITALKYYTDNSSGSFQKKEIRWSFNGDYWSSWSTLNQGNVSGISIGSNPYLFLEIRYTSAGGTVTSFVLNYDGAAQSPSTSDCPPDSDYTQIDKSISDETYLATNQCAPGSGSGSIDAATLCGKPCDYYLWRPNQKGQQPISSITDLQKILNNLAGGIQGSITDGQNMSSEGIGVFYDKQGQDLLFRTIDVSGGGLEIAEQDGVIYFTVDASFSIDDASLNQLYDFYYALESDLNDLSIYVDTKFINYDASFARIDSSINELYQLIADISLGGDSSIYGIENIGTGPGEVYRDTVLGIARLRTIRGAGDVSVYVDGDEIVISLDASITADSSIRGVDNIGGGSGEVFSSIDPSGIIQLRTLDGSGGTTVVTVGDRVIITSELTADTSITNIVNVGGGDALVLADIDSSGVAELRSISGSGAISVSQVGDQIVLYSDASITIDPCTWVDTDPISASVGGVGPGDTFVGNNAIQILEDILYEYFPPDVSISIIPNPGPTSPNGYYEKYVAAESGKQFSSGAFYSYSFNNDNFKKITVWDTSIFDGSGFSDVIPWAGAESGYRPPILSGSPPISTYNDLILNMIMDIKINGDPSVYITSESAKFVLPYFYGVIPDEKSPGVPYDYTNIDGNTILNYCSSTKIIGPKQSNEISFDVSENYKKVKFIYAYDASYGDLLSIFDVKNDFNVSSSFDVCTNVYIPNGNTPIGVTWRVYSKSHWISFTPDVSIFKLVFNI